MKKIVLFLFLVGFNNLIICQKNKWSIHNLNDLEQIDKYYLKNINSKKILKSKYPIQSFNHKEYLSILGKKNGYFEIQTLKNQGILIGTSIGSIFTCKVPLDKINFITNYNGIDYIEIAQKAKAHLDQALKDIKADSVHQGINLPQSYSGKDVYIGITDWGFDYTHPQFYDTLLQQNRIVAAWDQYKTSGPPPSGFSYGTEYQTISDLLNAQSDTANIYSYSYHGSHVAGICGGSGAGTPYRGVAYEAKYLFATFLIDAASVIDAYEWMYQKAQQDNKRLVINQSWGLHHIGNLDGTSILSQAIDYYSQLGVVFVSSGGNNGDVSFHIKKTFEQDTITTRVNFYDYNFPTMWGQSISLWGEENKSFQISMNVLNQSNNVIYQTAFYNSSLPDFTLDSLIVINSDSILFNISSESSNPLNNRPHMRWRIKNPYPTYKIILKMTAIDGTLHAWNVVELTNDVGNWGMSFSKVYSYYTGGDHYYGISEPACTKSTIAVASYQTFGASASFSSFGPTLDERMKPDIAAPGVNIASSISSFTDGNYTQLTSVNFNGRDYPYARLSGTSMSGPIVTGVVALLLEANPYLSPSQIKMILQESAREDNFTGDIPIEYSTKWGAGKINAYHAVQLALQTIGNVGLELKTINEKEFLIFPNPVTDYLFFKDSKLNQPAQIIDSNGKIILSDIQDGKIEVKMLKSGLYTLRFQNKNKIVHLKFVK